MGRSREQLQQPPTAQYDPAIDEIAAKHERAASLLIGTVAAFAAAPLTDAALSTTEKAVSAVLEALLAASLAWTAVNLPVVYRSGLEDAVRATEGPPQDELRTSVDEAMRKAAHREALRILAESLRDDLTNAVRSMGKDVAEALREIRQRNVERALGGDLASPTQDLAAEMRERGIGFMDQAGKRWKPESYAAMVVRTKVAIAYNAGHLNRALEMGSPGVRIFDGGPGDVDEPCVEANGQHWSLQYFARNLIEHPNCRRSGAALPRTWTGELDRV